MDDWPRPLPARTAILGVHVALEPMHRRHVDELFEAARGADESFKYMGYGPFLTKAELAKWVAASSVTHDPIFWVARPVVTGRASGWLALMDIQPGHAAIELGSIWFGPAMRRTRAATEAMFLLLRRAADELGYRRVVWKCNALNEASVRAAERLGFVREGVLRAHMVVKGMRRDTAMFSMTEAEWAGCRDAMVGWLGAENFDSGGTAIRGLAEFREK